LASNRKRSAQKPRIAERITKAVQQLDYDEVAARLYKGLVPYAPVATPLDLVNERHLNEGGRWLELNVGDERFKLPKLPIDFRETTAFAVRQPPGCLGEHTDAILGALGYSATEIAALKEQRVVLRSDRMLNIGSKD